MNIIIRNETDKDYRETENITREAFWDLYKPGCDEHFVLHKLRKSKSFVPELDFVALHENNIVGNIIYSKAGISDNEYYEVLCMGPLSVKPEYQKKGIGSMLLLRSLESARKMGFKAVVIFGNPDYYHRFGFRNAAEYNITTSEGANFDAFMVLELDKDSLMNIRGKFIPDKAFYSDKNELENFDRKFPIKEKHSNSKQL
ncbi:MAG TPA: N-acetyltransferase [Spirochaetota bacterium]|nr:N-acetyltransferase [Spirochaetota bacterium]HQE58388.1 N-acetyltransferase [Spirochaetota bacterium]